MLIKLKSPDIKNLSVVNLNKKNKMEKSEYWVYTDAWRGLGDKTFRMPLPMRAQPPKCWLNLSETHSEKEKKLSEMTSSEN